MTRREILRLEQRGPDCAVLWMDDPAEPVNTLKPELITEFEALLARIETMPALQVLVFASAKRDNFIVGANLDMLQAVTGADEARALSQTAQSMQARIARLRPSTVAAIHGRALGGGLELALAFGARIASDAAQTRLGLPEVRLGLLPGGGGTQRLPRLLGIERALDLLLTGREISARKARAYGLVDEVVAPEILIKAAIKLGREHAAGRGGGASHWSRTLQRARNWALGGNPLGRRLVLAQALKRTRRKTHGNYPAPERIIEVVGTGLEKGMGAGLDAEARAFGELLMSPQARQLIYLFFATTALKKQAVDGQEPIARPVRKVGVLGAGLMGAGIAFTSLYKTNADVRIKDRDQQGIAAGLRHIHADLRERVKRRSLTPLQQAQCLARLSTTTDYSGLGNCDLVIEAVFEDLELKRRVVGEVEAIAQREIIIASNTSALPIASIAQNSAAPERIIGMHYFSPVEKMPLLEIVVGSRTADWVVATCAQFGRMQGKTVIIVNDGPGFYTTRILAPYLNEAAHLLREGVPIELIDRALLQFGFAVGPMTLLDEVGIDVGHKVAASMANAFGDRMQVVPGMEKLVSDGRLGKKSGKGLYRYAAAGGGGGKQVDESVYPLLGVTRVDTADTNEIAERCVLQMVNEAVHCLGDGILRQARDGDVGAVFGLGFPPFLGGPFRYIDSRGAGVIQRRLQQLARRFGPRFQPAPLLEHHAREGQPFSGAT